MPIVSLCRCLPERLAGAFYYRCLKGRYSSKLELRDAPLRHAPGCRIRLPSSRDFMYETIFCTGGFEAQTSRVVRMAAEQGGLFCDVGANVGYFSLLWLAASPENQALLIEADERLAAIAASNLELNQYSKRAYVHACAAGAEPGYLGFQVYRNDVTGWGRLTRNSTNETQVRVATLDEMLGGRGATFLKIDVEGAEPLVFRGARSTLANPSLKTVVFELNKPGSTALGLDPEESLRVLQNAEFRLTPLDKAKPIMNWLATRGEN
jgi:FkbM family methyltransferase